MDGNLNEEVVCCFCGEMLLLREAVILNVQPDIQSDESQNLFCHRNHFIANIHKSIILHPDLFDELEQ
jgi:hypothetical protein